MAIPRRDQSPRSQASRSAIDRRLLADDRGDRLAGQVVRRRAESAGRRRRGRPARARSRTRRGPRRGRRGGPGSGRTATPSPVRLRASSPAFVSRVSPTVSSVPMLSSSAVRSGRGGAMLRAYRTAGAPISRRARHPPRRYHRSVVARPLPGAGAAGRDRPSSHRLAERAASAGGGDERHRAERVRGVRSAGGHWPAGRASCLTPRSSRAVSRRAAPRSSPTRRCPTSRASRPGSSAGSGRTRPASRSCGTSWGSSARRGSSRR